MIIDPKRQAGRAEGAPLARIAAKPELDDTLPEQAQGAVVLSWRQFPVPLGPLAIAMQLQLPRREGTILYRAMFSNR